MKIDIGIDEEHRVAIVNGSRGCSQTATRSI